MGANNQGTNQDSSSFGILWGIGLLFVIVGLIWISFKTQIISAYITVKLYELYFLEIISFIPFLNINNEISEMIAFLQTNRYTDDLGVLAYIAQRTGFFLAPFIAVFSGLLLNSIWKKNAQLRYVTKHTMSTLCAQEQQNWVKIMPVLPLKLIDIDVNTGPWAMALTPLQFVKKYELIVVETVVDRKTPWKTEGIKKANLIKEKALLTFKKQMGPLWEGEFALPDYAKALFAAFLARIEHDTKGSDELLEDLSVSYALGKPDFSMVEPLLKKHRQSKAAMKCVQNHAYVMTVMASMLKLARTDGVLATADFVWLKPIDRPLWYMLNCVGRQTPYCEVAGPWAHLIAENELGRPLFKPIIDQAVVALEAALEKIIYVDDDDKK